VAKSVRENANRAPKLTDQQTSDGRIKSPVPNRELRCIYIGAEVAALKPGGSRVANMNDLLYTVRLSVRSQNEVRDIESFNFP
jgi:hypothetical protein